MIVQDELIFRIGCVKLSDMTAQVIHLPSEGQRADATIRVTVRALMRGKGISVETLAPKMGLNPATLYRKLSDKKPAPFKAGEVAELASQLGVSVAQLYDGLGGTFTPPSDPEPADYPSGVSEAYRTRQRRVIAFPGRSTPAVA